MEQKHTNQSNDIASEIAERICSLIDSVSESVPAPRFSKNAESAEGSNSLDQSFLDSLDNKDNLTEEYLDQYYAAIN